MGHPLAEVRDLVPFHPSILPHTASICGLEPSRLEGDCQENQGNVLTRQTLENGNRLVHPSKMTSGVL